MGYRDASILAAFDAISIFWRFADVADLGFSACRYCRVVAVAVVGSQAARLDVVDCDLLRALAGFGPVRLVL